MLPLTHALWGAGRDFERYAGDFRAIEATFRARGRPFVYALREDGRIATSCKVYDRVVRAAGERLAAVGFGAVFTPAERRGRGYASALLGALLDRRRAAGDDLAFLYSDIHPAFYARLGFTALPSRTFRLPAERLDAARVRHAVLAERDWPALKRCFAATEARRPWSFARTPGIWSRVRAHWESPAPPQGQRVALVARQGAALAAYVVGVRYPREDEFWLLEFGCRTGAHEASLAGLLRAAAGDLRAIAGWQPPVVPGGIFHGARRRKRSDAILMMLALSARGRAWWRANYPATAAAPTDPGWQADHV